MKIGIVTITIDFSWFRNLYHQLIKRLILKRAYKGYCEFLRRGDDFKISDFPTFKHYSTLEYFKIEAGFNFYLHYFKKKTAYDTWFYDKVSIKDIIFS